jgi:glyoxylase-like metal-dependent hydrolase (beta-lactamase superfamily II)
VTLSRMISPTARELYVTASWNAIVATSGGAGTRLALVAASQVTRVQDTCNVWVIRSGRDGVCIDFGAGTVLDRLDELGIERLTDVLVTHHHRDSVQGLARAAAAGARIWVPPVEQDLFTDARGFWQRRRTRNLYALRQDDFSLLDSIEIAGTVDEYRERSYGGVDIYTLPTPGHTLGSVSYIAELDGRRTAFTGDLIFGPGQVWSLAATQWSYSGVEGLSCTLLSLGTLARRGLDAILPAHGEPMEPSALGETERRVAEVMELRRVEEHPFDYERWLSAPWRAVTPHVLLNTTSISNSYALLSGSGEALLVDFGYDLWTGWANGGDRHECRPLLSSIEALRRDHGVERIEALVTTHYHDDHVAGANLLREVEGTEVWAPENVAPILEAPDTYDLPCLWFDPVAVDRVLPLDEPVRWREYELTPYALPGHTLYAAAISFEADGKRFLATGDQQSAEGNGAQILNYQYRNRFRIDDFVESAELYARLRPDLLLTGHWGAHELTAGQIAGLERDGRRLAELHRELLPVPNAEGLFARVVPYRLELDAGTSATVEVEVRNPFTEQVEARVALVVPTGLGTEPAQAELTLAPGETRRTSFSLAAGGTRGRLPIAATLQLGELDLGQHTTALVTVT